jgi:hypothetical protein
MTPERWQQVKEILHGALEKEPEERQAFLAQACQTDPALKSEVESFLASGSNVIEDLLHSAPSERPGLQRGIRLGPYEIVTLIGAGGMGEVYRARDTRLERDVAIKVLPFSLPSARSGASVSNARHGPSLPCSIPTFAPCLMSANLMESNTW